MLTAIRRGETFQALRNRNFRLLWIGQVGHSASLWVETVARSWLIWQLTGSATLLATVNLLRALPMLGLGLFAGVAADRFDKRRLLIIVKTFTLLNKLTLAILVTTGRVEVWHVLLTAFLMGCSMAFEQPTRTSLIPSLVTKDELVNAVALNSAAMNLTRVLGPAVAGLLIAPLGIGGVYYASSGVYVVTIIATIMLQVPPVIERVGRPSVWADASAGLRYVSHEKIVLALMLLGLVPMTFAQPYMTLMPVFADKVFNIGAAGLGWLYSAAGVGALSAVLIIATLGKVRRKGVVILSGVFGFGAFLVALSQSTLLPLSLIFIAGVGFASTGSMSLINAGLLDIAPEELRGRVMAVYMLDRGLVPLGAMTAGLLTDAAGAPFAVLVMGSICILLVPIIGIGFPMVRRIP